MDVRRLLVLSCVGVIAGTFPESAGAQESAESPAESKPDVSDDAPTSDDQGSDASNAGEPEPEPGEEPSTSDPVDAGEPVVDENQVFAPVLVDFVEAAYPPEASAARIEGIVVMKLSIDTEGAVTDAVVDAPAGHGFDEAAVEAAKQFRFQPARRGSTPVPARILYTYEFELPPEGAISGTVLVPDPASEEPVAGVAIEVEAPDGQLYVDRTDVEGQFNIMGLSPGTYVVQAEAEGIGSISTSLTVADDRTTETTLRLLPPEDQSPIEVTVWGDTDVERLRRSSQAVQVIELDEAKREGSDLGEVLARTEGINIRRSGGFGSPSEICINGLCGNQVRIFLDGIPLELAGFPGDVSTVPIQLLDRVEVYRGVVPIQFGVDALGAAINLVTDDDLTGTAGSVNYTGGSFDLHRLSATARHQHEPSGFFIRALGFFDTVRNDYRIQVEVPDEQGRLSEETVYRFHDKYRQGGGSLELGVVDKKWADRLLFRGFGAAFQNEIQHNVVMTVPYGEVEQDSASGGGIVRYVNRFNDRFGVNLAAGYTYLQTEFRDVAECVYDWFGQCIRERPIAGEIEPFPRDQIVSDNTIYGRLNFAWRISPNHQLSVAVAPDFFTRSGEDRLLPEESVDPLTARRDVADLVTGVEYLLTLVDTKLENRFFVKNYLQFARSEEPLPGGAFRNLNRDTNRFGIGNGIRYAFADWVYVKASYEYATRLPTPGEIFGDAALIVPNLELAPEVAHNANVSTTIDLRDTNSGEWRMDANAFLRDVDRAIVLLGNDRVFSFQNVFGARSVGIEGSAGWTMKDEWLSIDANATYQSYRNTSGEGTFGEFKGDRIPALPYLFANGITRFKAKDIGSRNDEFTIVWYLRYTHSFFRTWESAGIREFKQVVPAQLLNTVAATYILRARRNTLSFTAQVENIGDRAVFDFFGVQRPGRQFLFALRGELYKPTEESVSNE